MMKISEIKEKTSGELESKLVEIKKNLISLKFKKATSQLDNNTAINNLKKDIARIETMLQQKKEA